VQTFEMLLLLLVAALALTVIARWLTVPPAVTLVLQARRSELDGEEEQIRLALHGPNEGDAIA
jgi:hypothetical protein